MRKALSSSVLFIVLALAGPVAAAEATFITPDRLDLTKILAPAPASDSEQQKRDVAAVLDVQKTRTEAESQRALADASASTFIFADVLGPNFMPSACRRWPRCSIKFVAMRWWHSRPEKASGTGRGLSW